MGGKYDLWKSAAKDYGLKIQVNGIPAPSSFKPTHDNWLLYKTYITESMLDNRILAGSSFYCSIAHKHRHLETHIRSENLSRESVNRYMKEEILS